MLFAPLGLVAVFAFGFTSDRFIFKVLQVLAFMSGVVWCVLSASIWLAGVLGRLAGSYCR